MKFFHLSDLHIGKRLHELSLVEDQRYILRQILTLCRQHRPDGLLIAGDIYDKSIPPAEAVTLFDDFLTEAAKMGLTILLVSGNHDSPERLNFGGRLLTSSGVWLQGSFSGGLNRLELQDEYGPLDIWLLPFVRPAAVRPFFPDREIADTHAAVEALISAAPIAENRRNVLISHQFVTGKGDLPRRADSEAVSVGGSDNVDVSVFAPFDYVALGHLHIPQAVGRETVRYCGSPLKYSFSEAGNQKSVTAVTFREKGDVLLETLPLRPLHDLREIRGPLAALTSPEVVEAADREDYLRVTLTDDEALLNPLDRLRECYPNLLRLDFDNRRSRAEGVAFETAETADRPLSELFSEFYEKQQGLPLAGRGREIAERLLKGLEEVRP